MSSVNYGRSGVAHLSKCGVELVEPVWRKGEPHHLTFCLLALKFLSTSISVSRGCWKAARNVATRYMLYTLQDSIDVFQPDPRGRYPTGPQMPMSAWNHRQSVNTFLCL